MHLGHLVPHDNPGQAVSFINNHNHDQSLEIIYAPLALKTVYINVYRLSNNQQKNRDPTSVSHLIINVDEMFLSSTLYWEDAEHLGNSALSSHKLNKNT